MPGVIPISTVLSTSVDRNQRIVGSTPAVGFLKHVFASLMSWFELSQTAGVGDETWRRSAFNCSVSAMSASSEREPR